MSPATEVEGLLRELAPQVLGILVRRFGGFDTCEDAVQEALLAASVQWPREGVPDHPKAWLVTVASRRRTELWRNEAARRRREERRPRWSRPTPSRSQKPTTRSSCCFCAVTRRSPGFPRCP